MLPKRRHSAHPTDGSNNQHNAPTSKEAALRQKNDWVRAQVRDATSVEKPETTRKKQGEDAENRPE